MFQNPPDISNIYRLNRFTTLPILLDLLERKKLVLLDPKTWDDKNDSEIVLEYKRRKNVDRVLALCFSYADRTIHHWKTFSDGISGCCIEFEAASLRKLFDINGLKHGPVVYKKIAEIDSGSIVLDEMPFTKRWPYFCEREYRVIREDNETAAEFEVEVDLGDIRKITVSQRMPWQVFKTIKDILGKASPKSEVRRSRLYEHRNWIEKFRNA